MAKDEDIARIQGAHELGLAIVRAVVLLNSGAFAVLLAYMAGAKADALIVFDLAGLQKAMYCFLIGIVSILGAVIISYVYTALNFTSPTRSWLDNKVIPMNAVLAIFSVVAFSVGVVSLIGTAQIQ